MNVHISYIIVALTAVVVRPTAAQVRTLFDLAQERRLMIEAGKQTLTYDADWADNIGRDLEGLTR
jgi:hypothetical protein